MTQKKKILIFIDWFLPGYKAGGPVRSMANMIEYLAEQYEFYIITRNTDYTETRPYSSVEANTWVTYQQGVKVFYADTYHQNKATFRELMDEVKPDVAYINGVYSWKFSILPLLVLRKAAINKVIVATRGMLAKSAIDVKGGKKRLFLKLAKVAGLYKKVVFHATNSKEELDIYTSIGKGARVCIADNLPKKHWPEIKPVGKKKGELKLVSLARIAPEKNTLFALERLAELSAFDGLVQFDLYGQIYNEDYWTQCQDVIRQLPASIKVNYKGTVEADKVGETIQHYHALYMPTQGENFGHVILESLSAGRPVLISDQTPWRNLSEITAGWDLPLGGTRNRDQGSGNREQGLAAEEVSIPIAMGRDTEDSWHGVIESLLRMEQAEFDTWCEGARKRAETFVNNPELLRDYAILFGDNNRM